MTDQAKLPIALIAYSCDPTKGSEYHIGWSWALHLSQLYDVTVITHPRNEQSLRRSGATDSGMAAFEIITLPHGLDPWRVSPEERFAWFRYTAWQMAAAYKVMSLNRQRRFRLIHHCSWGTLTGPTLAWLTGIPFVWGPIGGGQTTPMQLSGYLGRGAGWERLRNLRIKLMGAMPWVRMAARRARHCFVTNHETLNAIQRVGGKNVSVMPLDAIRDTAQLASVIRGENERSRIVWVGRLLPRKAPLLALEIHARVLRTVDAELVFAGDGDLRRDCEARARELGIQDRVTFLGQVAFEDIPAVLSQSDLMIFTSIRDSFPQVALEALAKGLPVVLLGHHGAELLPQSAVISIPVSSPVETVSNLAKAVVRVLTDSALREKMSHAAVEEIRRSHLWSHRVEMVNTVYESILAAESARTRVGQHEARPSEREDWKIRTGEFGQVTGEASGQRCEGASGDRIGSR